MQVTHNDGSQERGFFDDNEKLLQELAKQFNRTSVKKIEIWKDIHRNDPCPCRSGKKAKKCCWDKRFSESDGKAKE